MNPGMTTRHSDRAQFVAERFGAALGAEPQSTTTALKRSTTNRPGGYAPPSERNSMKTCNT